MAARVTLSLYLLVTQLPLSFRSALVCPPCALYSLQLMRCVDGGRWVAQLRQDADAHHAQQLLQQQQRKRRRVGGANGQHVNNSNNNSIHSAAAAAAGSGGMLREPTSPPPAYLQHHQQLWGGEGPQLIPLHDTYADTLETTTAKLWTEGVCGVVCGVVEWVGR